MDLITELRNTADLAHAVTGCSLRKHPCTLAADEIEKLRGLLLNITHHDGALKEFEPLWSPIVRDELARRMDMPNV
ncbi:MAG: hypothetical protein LUQ18_01175 [Methylococcaceae bacterium]|nr:hypothetical protein [Methylococcaceae bacterium]